MDSCPSPSIHFIVVFFFLYTLGLSYRCVVLFSLYAHVYTYMLQAKIKIQANFQLAYIRNIDWRITRIKIKRTCYKKCVLLINENGVCKLKDRYQRPLSIAYVLILTKFFNLADTRIFKAEVIRITITINPSIIFD